MTTSGPAEVSHFDPFSHLGVILQDILTFSELWIFMFSTCNVMALKIKINYQLDRLSKLKNQQTKGKAEIKEIVTFFVTIVTNSIYLPKHLLITFLTNYTDRQVRNVHCPGTRHSLLLFLLAGPLHIARRSPHPSSRFPWRPKLTHTIPHTPYPQLLDKSANYF